MTEAEPVTEEELLATYVRAWNAHDAGSCADCFAPDGVREFRLHMRCPASGSSDPVVRGRREIAREIGRLLGDVDDLSVEVLGAGYSSDRRLWTEWRAAGTLAGNPDGGGRDARAIDVVGVSVFRLSNEGFLEERLYCGPALVLGAHPRVSRRAG